MMDSMKNPDTSETYTVPVELVETGRIRVQNLAEEAANRLKEQNRPQGDNAWQRFWRN